MNPTKHRTFALFLRVYTIFSCHVCRQLGSRRTRPLAHFAPCAKSDVRGIEDSFHFAFCLLITQLTLFICSESSRCRDDARGRSDPDRQKTGQDGVSKQHGETLLTRTAGALSGHLVWCRKASECVFKKTRLLLHVCTEDS